MICAPRKFGAIQYLSISLCVSTDDLLSFLHSCAESLPQGSGVIVVKENIALDGDDIFDDNDSSVTR